MNAIQTIKIAHIVVLASFVMGNVCFGKDVNITDYGAVADGKTVNSGAIQNAIDDCNKTGGGRVYVPAGKWLCGTILLKTNVTLFLNDNAVLSGSTNILDYFIVDGFTDGTGQAMGYCFVGAVNARNVGIEGGGTIDGQGKLLLSTNGKTKRPFLVRFVGCTQVSISGLHLQASAAWTMHLFRCKNVTVQGLTIFSRGLANNDGIDIDCCEDVQIKNCDITSDDDAICFKTTSPYPCKNIIINDIKARTNCSAVKFGTESTGDFQNIRISGIRVSYAGLGVIKILSVDGSHISDISIRDVEADTANVPVMIRLGARLKTFRQGDIKKPVGTISNVKIRGLNIKHATTTAIILTGVPGHSVESISLEDVVINSSGGGTAGESEVKLAENEAAYPEVRMFGTIIPSYGMYLRHAKYVQVKNISFTSGKPDDRTAIIAEDVVKIKLISWSLPVTSSTAPLISLSGANDVVLQSFNLKSTPSTFLKVDGKDSRGIKILNSKVLPSSSIKQEIDVPADAVQFKKQ